MSMNDFTAFYALATFILISSITPGPNNLMLMASGTNFGMRRTLPHMLGICSGVMIMIGLVSLGISRIFEQYSLSMTILKFFSVAYLLYLAYKIATSKTVGNADTINAKPFTIIQAMLFQWINPKAWAMCLSIITVYQLPHDLQFKGLYMIAIFTLINMPSIACWAFMGTRIRRFLNHPVKLKVFNWLCAGLLIATLIPILL